MEAKEIKNYWVPPNKKMQLYCKIYLWFSGFAVIAWSIFLMYVFIGEGKDGEFCIYTQDLNNYHIILDGEPCSLQWYTLFVFLYFIIIFLVPAQLPAWILLLYLKYLQKKVH